MGAEHKIFYGFSNKGSELNKNMLRRFSPAKKVIVYEKNPQNQCHVSVTQAVDERVQHGGDHCVHHGSNDVSVMGLA